MKPVNIATIKEFPNDLESELYLDNDMSKVTTKILIDIILSGRYRVGVGNKSTLKVKYYKPDELEEAIIEGLLYSPKEDIVWVLGPSNRIRGGLLMEYIGFLHLDEDK